MMLVLVMIALAAGALAVTLLSSFGAKLRSDRVTENALAKAKDALIAYAVTDPNRPGELPCPDLVTNIGGNIPNDGIADLLAGADCPSYVGRLPWKTLALPDLRDGAGERLWYAVSKDFHAGGTATLNSDTQGQLTVTGITPATNVVAIVFAPGSALSGQSRTTANTNAASEYLEGVNATSNADTTTTFTTADASVIFDDRLITIRPAEIFRLVEKRVAHELRPIINKYYTDWGRYPMAAAFTNPTTSDFKGTAATDNGLLPVTLDPTFITWNTAASAVTVSGGITLGGAASCAVVAGNVLDCSVPIALSLLGQTVTVTAIADNVGRAVLINPVLEADVDYVGLTPIPALFTRSLNVPLQGQIQAVGRTGLILLLTTVHIRVPLPSFNPPVLPAWILDNNWHHVIFYAGAAGWTADGTGACTPPVNTCDPGPPVTILDNCLSLCNRTTVATTNNVRALIIMTGGALSGQTHPSSNLSDYLDADGNVYGNPSVVDLVYENKPVTATFNDQPFVLTP